MFQTDERWEEIATTELLRKVFDQPGLRQYACVEVPYNVDLFHINICCLDENTSPDAWSRYIVDNVTAAVSLADSVPDAPATITLQTKLLGDNIYRMYRIREITEVILKTGKFVYICVCENDELYVLASVEVTDAEIATRRSVWSAKL